MKRNTLKKTIAFVMAFTLVAGTLPANVGGFLTGGTAIVASAEGEVEISNLWIGGSAEITAAGVVNGTNGSGTATVSTEGDSVVLELNNFSYEGTEHSNVTEFSSNTAGIYYEGTAPLRIKLIGNNSITTSAVTSGNNYAIYSFKQSSSVTIEGTGVDSSLAVTSGNAESNSSAIYVGGALTISKCTLNATGGSATKYGSYGIRSGQDVTIDGANVTATGGTGGIASYGIQAFSSASGPCNVIFKSGKLTASGSKSAFYYGDNDYRTKLTLGAGITPTELKAGDNADNATDTTLEQITNQKYISCEAEVPVTVALTADNTTIADLTYTGEPQSPVLKYGDTPLVKDTDYELVTTAGDTTSATNAGTYTIHINGMGDYYEGSNVALTWKINKADPTATAPTGLTAAYGQTLSDVPLTNPSGNTPGVWSWTDAGTSVGSVDTHTFQANFTPTDTNNYNSVNNVNVSITVNKAQPTYTAPTARNQTYYSGNVQLIGAGSATNGTMSYSLGTEAVPGDTWGTDATEITANASGTYYVWYKVTGDANYADIEPKCVTVTLSKYVAPTTSKSSQTWTLTMDSYAYDGTAHEPTINGTTRGIVTYTYYNTDTDEELTEAPSAVGNYKVKVYASGNNAYNSRSLIKTYSITDPIDKNGMASVDAFKANGTVPASDGKIFAGWFTDETCTTAYTEDTGKAYAKFIDENILTVKAQISSGTTANSEKTSIRFITSVDSLKYQNVGFKITCNGKTIDRKMTKVYTAINANGAKVKPTVFSADSHYMEAYTLNNIPKDAFGKTFTVTPYYTTQDGTIVEGATNTFTIANMIK